MFGAPPPFGVTQGAVQAFAQVVKFRRLPIDVVYARYEELDTDQNDQVGVEGVMQLTAGMFNAYNDDAAKRIVAFLDEDRIGRVNPGKGNSSIAFAFRLISIAFEHCFC